MVVAQCKCPKWLILCKYEFCLKKHLKSFHSYDTAVISEHYFSHFPDESNILSKEICIIFLSEEMWALYSGWDFINDGK